MGVNWINSLGRRPHRWDQRYFLIPHKCFSCQEKVWGRGLIGHVYWTYDIDTYYQHVECRAMEVLSGDEGIRDRGNAG